MIKRIRTNKTGGQLLELLIGFALLLVFLAGATTLLSRHFTTFQAARNQEKVAALFQESIEGLYAISQEDWESLATGTTYGITNTSGLWALVPTEDTQHEGFRRSIVVDSVFHDEENCQINEKGTVEDPDRRLLRIQFEWEERGKTLSQERPFYLSRWKDPIHCTSKTRAEEIFFDTADAKWEENGTELADLKLVNNGRHTAIIEYIAMDWVNPKAGLDILLNEIVMEQNVVWSGSMPRLNIIDVNDPRIPGGSSIITNRLKFDGDLRGQQIGMSFIFNDGSTTTFQWFTPN